MQELLRSVGVLIVTVACSTLAATTSAGARPSPAAVHLVSMSETAPDLSGCFGGAVDPASPGTAQVGAETEPHLAVNPADPDHLVAAWQLNKSSLAAGGAQTDLVGVSEDGGRSWRQVLVPGLSSCTGGSEPLVSDPWLSIGGDGAVYLASLVFPADDAKVEEADGFVTAGWEAAVQVSVSGPGQRGLTWESPVVVKARDDGQFHDRPAVAAHPTRPGVAHLAFVTHLPPYYLTSVAWSSFTTDGGRTWSIPLPLATSTPGVFAGTAINVVDDGTAHGVALLTLTESNHSQFLVDTTGVEPLLVPSRIRGLRSADGGRTWSEQVLAEVLQPYSAEYIGYVPHAEQTVSADGTVYVVWQSRNGRSSSTLFARRSDDAGRTWSPPMVVAAVAGEIAMTAAAARPGGEIGVTYYDFRNDPVDDDGELVTDVWFAQSRDRGLTWRESHLAGPFDFTDSPSGFGGVGLPFLGHYIGSVATADGYATALPLTTSYAVDGPTDLYLARIRPRR